MGAMQRTKGATAEREIASILRDLANWDVRRRVRQHDGDSDLEGIPNWSAEVKRHATAQRHEIAAWWRQTVAQASSDYPVLFYRQDRGDWRAVWPVAVLLGIESWQTWLAYDMTCDSSIGVFVCVAREVEV